MLQLNEYTRHPPSHQSQTLPLLLRLMQLITKLLRIILNICPLQKSPLHALTVITSLLPVIVSYLEYYSMSMHWGSFKILTTSEPHFYSIRIIGDWGQNLGTSIVLKYFRVILIYSQGWKPSFNNANLTLSLTPMLE